MLQCGPGCIVFTLSMNAATCDRDHLSAWFELDVLGPLRRGPNRVMDAWEAEAVYR